MVAVIVVYSVINFVIQSIIQPRVVGDAVGLSPTLTFLSLVFWTWVDRPARRAARRPAEPARPGAAGRGRPPHPVGAARSSPGKPDRASRRRAEPIAVDPRSRREQRLADRAVDERAERRASSTGGSPSASHGAGRQGRAAVAGAWLQRPSAGCSPAGRGGSCSAARTPFVRVGHLRPVDDDRRPVLHLRAADPHPVRDLGERRDTAPIADAVACREESRVVLEDAVQGADSAAFGIVGALMVLVSATSLSRALTRAFAEIWHLPRPRTRPGPPGAGSRWSWRSRSRWSLVRALIAAAGVLPPRAVWPSPSRSPATWPSALFVPVGAARRGRRAPAPGPRRGALRAHDAHVPSRQRRPGSRGRSRRARTATGPSGVAFTYLAWLYVASFILLATAVVGQVVATDVGRLGELIRGVADPEPAEAEEVRPRHLSSSGADSSRLRDDRRPPRTQGGGMRGEASTAEGPVRQDGQGDRACPHADAASLDASCPGRSRRGTPRPG